MVQGSGLFMHLTSLNEVITEMQADDDKKFQEKVVLGRLG